MQIKLVSVIIPVFNNEKTIENVIRNVLLVRAPVPREVIVVDDGSTDKTPQIIRRFPEIICLAQKNSGPASARNYGASVAKGEILFYTDSDCLVHADWMERMLYHFSKDNVAAVCGSYGIANPQNLLARCIFEEIIFRHRILMPDYPKVFGSYNLAIRKDILERLGGFDASYRYPSGEDNALSYKILQNGYRIFFDREALVDHYHPDNLKSYLGQQFRHGFWRAKIYMDFPSRTRGDNYTFWKDSVEVLVSGIAGVALIAAPQTSVALFFGLYLLEIFWSIRMINGIQGRTYFAGVMLIRALARTLGFIQGVLYFVARRVSPGSRSQHGRHAANHPMRIDSA